MPTLVFPEVQERLRTAESVLHHAGENFDFQRFLEGSAEDLASTRNIHFTAICTCAIQLGIVDRLTNKGVRPDWVMGCSLGDLARSIVCGLVEFEQVVATQLSLFEAYRNLEEDYVGINIGIRSPARQPFSASDFDWFDAQGIQASRMAPRFLQMSLTEQQYQAVKVRTDLKNWQLKQAEFDILLHAENLQHLSQSVIEGLNGTELGEPAYKIYSSILNQPLSSLPEIVDEARQILWRPLRWQEAVCSLQKVQGVSQFINIGPCKSLSALQRQISPHCRPVEAMTLI